MTEPSRDDKIAALAAERDAAIESANVVYDQAIGEASATYAEATHQPAHDYVVARGAAELARDSRHQQARDDYSRKLAELDA